MNLQEHFAQLRPGKFFLDPRNIAALQAWLEDRAWLQNEERVLAVEKAGEGNMNCTLRVRTGSRSFIVKQARPWVEKYPAYAAPDERSMVEASFYAAVQGNRAVSGKMPRLLASDDQDKLLIIEDLGEAPDLTSMYAGVSLADFDLEALVGWLRALHEGSRGSGLQASFQNRAMRELNHEHIFALPLRKENGLQLNGLNNAADSLKKDAGYVQRVTELGEMYLAEGTCLLHGDFFPGSWVRAQNAIWVIDPEFGFWGPPEFDTGVLLAHLKLARAPAEQMAMVQASKLAIAFAGVEIMRRLIGVAQLPLPYGAAEKARLLEESRQMVGQA